MKTTGDLLKYLFQDSQLVGAQLAEFEEVAELVEAETTALVTDLKPLAKVLKQLGFTKVEVKDDPNGPVAVFTDTVEYDRAVAVLADPVVMEELAKAGWVAQVGSGKDAVRFIEIKQPDPVPEKADTKPPKDTSKEVAKQVKAAQQPPAPKAESVLDEGTGSVSVVTDDPFNQEWYKPLIGMAFRNPPSFAHVVSMTEADARANGAEIFDAPDHVGGPVAEGSRLCPKGCGQLVYGGEVGAPGHGKVWECPKCSKRLIDIGGSLIDPETVFGSSWSRVPEGEAPPWELSPEDVR